MAAGTHQNKGDYYVWIGDKKHKVGTSAGLEAWTHFTDLPTYSRSISRASKRHAINCLGIAVNDNKSLAKVRQSFFKYSARYKWSKLIRELEAITEQRRALYRAELQRQIDEQDYKIGADAMGVIAAKVAELEPDDIPVAMLDKLVKTFSDLRRRAVQTDTSWNSEKLDVSDKRDVDSLLDKLKAVAKRDD